MDNQEVTSNTRAKRADGLSDDAVWDRCMRATDLVLSRQFADEPTLLCKHLVATLNDLTFDEVGTLSPFNFAVLSADALKLVGRMIIDLGLIPAVPIEQRAGEKDGQNVAEKPPT